MLHTKKKGSWAKTDQQTTQTEDMPQNHKPLLFKNVKTESSRRGSAEMNLTRIHEDAGLIPGLAQCVKDLALP